MRTIIVGFSHSTKHFAPFSLAIKYWDKTPYSHVYFQFESKVYSLDLVYQASSTMLNFMCKDVFLGFNAVVHEIPLEVTEEQYVLIMGNCMRSAGLQYSVLQILGMVLADIFHLKTNPFPDPVKYVCSEWVAEQLEQLGYTFNKPLDLVRPKDILAKFTMKGLK